MKHQKITEKDVARFASSIRRQKDDWVDSRVVPHLVHLLNIAQRRLRRPLKFLEGMGTFTFSLGTSRETLELESQLTEAAAQPFYPGANPIIQAMRQRFPELIEFCDIVCWVMDELDTTVGDIVPTVQPRGG